VNSWGALSPTGACAPCGGLGLFSPLPSHLHSNYFPTGGCRKLGKMLYRLCLEVGHREFVRRPELRRTWLALPLALLRRRIPRVWRPSCLSAPSSFLGPVDPLFRALSLRSDVISSIQILFFCSHAVRFTPHPRPPSSAFSKPWWGVH